MCQLDSCVCILRVCVVGLVFFSEKRAVWCVARGTVACRVEDMLEIPREVWIIYLLDFTPSCVHINAR